MCTPQYQINSTHDTVIKNKKKLWWHFVFQEQRLRYLKQQEQRQQQQASEQEKLLRLRENIENQETRLKKVRALKGQVEQKRLSNGKLSKQQNQ